MVTTQQLTELIEDAHRSSQDLLREPSLEDDDIQDAMHPKYLDDVTDVSEDTVISEDAISLSVAKQQYAEELEAEMEDEFNRGLLISKQQYDQLRFEDDKIVALRNAKVSWETFNNLIPLFNSFLNPLSQDIRELYQLAEEIITGGVFEEAPEECEEEAVPEDEGEGSTEHD